MATQPLTGARRSALAHWTPNWTDLLVVGASWALVVAALSAATFIATPDRGLLYFLVYGLLGATVFGIGIPLAWMVVVRARPLADLGLTLRHWRWSLVLQALFAALLYVTAYAGVQIPDIRALAPLVALALAIGFFEALFWRGWVLLRLEESFGLLPAILLGSLLYAAYHVGYGMDLGEMAFLFVIGILFAVTFRITSSVLMLWPVFQPMGQLVTLIEDELDLPLIATLGFAEVLIVMVALVVLVGRYHWRHGKRATART